MMGSNKRKNHLRGLNDHVTTSELGTPSGDNNGEENPAVLGGFTMLQPHQRDELTAATPVETWMNFGSSQWHQPQQHYHRPITPAAEQNNGSSTSTDLIPLGAMPYRDFRVKIFQKMSGNSNNIVLYEPLFTLDPDSIVIKQDQVRFRVTMWNPEVEAKVLNWLKHRSNDNLYVQVLPFTEIQLVKLVDEMEFQVPSKPTVWYQLKESLPFHLQCKSDEAAEKLVSEIRLDPELWVIQNLVMECKIIPGEGSSKEESSQRFGLNVISGEFITDDRSEKKLQDVLNRIEMLQLQLEESQGVRQNMNQFLADIETKGQNLLDRVNQVEVNVRDIHNLKRVEERQKEVRQTNVDADVQQVLEDQFAQHFHSIDLTTQISGVKAILTNFGTTNKGVFPVIRASIPFQTKVSKYLSFGHQETDVNDTHGILDKVTGLFRIGTSGLYLFLFNGLAAKVGLKVNGIEISGAKVVHFEIPMGSSGSADAFWALLELTKGDRVGIFCVNQSVVYTTNSAKNCKFSGILLAYDFQPDV